MKKKYSLKRNEEIAKIVHLRKYVKNSVFVIYYFENLENEHSRICISVGKKNGNAVVRNKIKRQIRSFVDAIFDFNKSIDYVIVVRNDFINNTYEVNKEKLNDLYNRINFNEKKELKA